MPDILRTRGGCATCGSQFVVKRTVLLLGGTDLTLAIARHFVDAGIALAGVVSPLPEFRISYSSTSVHNTRYVDLSEWCRDRRIPFMLYQTTDVLEQAALDSGAAAALVAGWYHMVPARVRRAFSCGCVGIHASLLPRYRGGAPLTWALLNEESEAGVSLLELGEGVDDGPLYDQRRFPIAAHDYIGDLVAKAEAVTLEMLRETFPNILSGALQPRPQHGEPLYCLQRQPSDGIIDWRRPAADIARLVRAVSRPYPGARTVFESTEVTIWRACVAESKPVVHGVPGQIVRLREFGTSPGIVTGSGVLLLEEVEGAGGLDCAALAGFHQRRLGTAPPAMSTS